MMNTPIFDIVHTSSVVKPYQAGLNRSSAGSNTVNPDNGCNFDSVLISEKSEGSGRICKDMVSKISNEIRTATTTGRIQELHQAVVSGTYRPDPARIAKCILYHLEG